jgi:hypothetical protein
MTEIQYAFISIPVLHGDLALIILLTQYLSILYQYSSDSLYYISMHPIVMEAYTVTKYWDSDTYFVVLAPYSSNENNWRVFSSL